MFPSSSQTVSRHHVLPSSPQTVSRHHMLPPVSRLYHVLHSSSQTVSRHHMLPFSFQTVSRAPLQFPDCITTSHAPLQFPDCMLYLCLDKLPSDSVMQFKEADRYFRGKDPRDHFASIESEGRKKIQIIKQKN